MNIQGLLKLTHEKNKRANKKLSICLLLYLVFRIPLLFLVPYFNTYVNYVMNLNIIFIPLIILFTLITMTFFTENLSHVFFNNKKIMWLYIKEIPRYIILNLIFLGLLHHIYNFFIDPMDTLLVTLVVIGFILVILWNIANIFAHYIMFSMLPFHLKILDYICFDRNDRKWPFFYPSYSFYCPFTISDNSFSIYLNIILV